MNWSCLTFEERKLEKNRKLKEFVWTLSLRTSSLNGSQRSAPRYD